MTRRLKPLGFMLVALLALSLGLTVWPTSIVQSASPQLFEHWNEGDVADTAESATNLLLMLAQTFTAQQDHSVTSIRVKLRGGGAASDGDLVVYLWGDDLGVERLGEAVIPGTTIGGTAAWYTVYFLSAPDVVGGELYYIIVYFDGYMVPPIYWRCDDVSDPDYPGGAAYISGITYPYEWGPRGAGYSDFMFEVWGTLPVYPNFSGSPTSGPAPLTVQFTDLSTGPVSSWLWDFGDGGTSFAQHPSHTYDMPGTYTVVLGVDGEVEIKSGYITVDPSPDEVSLVAGENQITADGVSTCSLTATVEDQLNNPVPDGTDVVFYTDHGTLGSSTVTNQTSGGVATATLTSEASTETVIATVTATADSASGATAVFFIPSGGVGIEGSETETVSDSGAMTDSLTGGDVSIDAEGDHTITVAAYTENPGGEPTFESSGDYYDVHLDDDSGVNNVTIEFCPAEQGDVIYYLNGTNWEPCSSQTYSGGCIVVTITDSTAPDLVDLAGLPFAQGRPLAPPVGGEAYPIDRLGILAPLITLAIVFAASGLYLVRRTVNKSA